MKVVAQCFVAAWKEGRAVRETTFAKALVVELLTAWTCLPCARQRGVRPRKRA